MEKENKKLEAVWEINWDGWNPYCSNCGYVPSEEVYKDDQVPDICPKCKALMVNANELNK